MLQKEMFERKSIGEHLGSGLFSNAYRLSNGLVCKVGGNDGTRNWLEFCCLEREAGRLMDLMPEVYAVVSVEGNKYVAIMPEYGGYSYDKAYSGSSCMNHPAFGELSTRFEAYMGQFMEVMSQYDLFNDLHAGNVMMCPKRGVIITDPSAHHYIELNVDSDKFELVPTLH